MVPLKSRLDVSIKPCILSEGTLCVETWQCSSEPVDPPVFAILASDWTKSAITTLTRSWTTVDNCELLDVQEQLLMDSLTEWISNTQDQINEASGTDNTRKSWAIITGLLDQRLMCVLPSHHVWTIERLGFLEESALSSLPQSCANQATT